MAVETKSFPYFFSKTSRIANNSGISEHRGAANIKLDIPSFRSAGHTLNIEIVMRFYHVNNPNDSNEIEFCITPLLCNDRKSGHH